MRVFLAVYPVDMRGGHNALSGMVRRLGLEPLDGHVYACLDRRRFMAALLGSGCCVLKKRLSRRTFQVLEVGTTSVRIDSVSRAALLTGHG